MKVVKRLKIAISGDCSPLGRLCEMCMREIAGDVRDCDLRGLQSPREIVRDVHAGDCVRYARRPPLVVHVRYTFLFW